MLIEENWNQRAFVVSSLQRACRFWNAANTTIKINRDVTFDEHHRLVDIPEESPLTGPETRPLPLVSTHEDEPNDESTGPITPHPFFPCEEE